MTEQPIAGSPAKTRIMSALLLALIVVCFPFALMMAGMSVMAFDAGVTNDATVFVSVMWIGVLLLLIAGVLALAALIMAGPRLLKWAVTLTVLPMVAVVAVFVVAAL